MHISLLLVSLSHQRNSGSFICKPSSLFHSDAWGAQQAPEHQREKISSVSSLLRSCSLSADTRVSVTPRSRAIARRHEAGGHEEQKAVFSFSSPLHHQARLAPDRSAMRAASRWARPVHAARSTAVLSFLHPRRFLRPRLRHNPP